ncbi:unnamed protein product [Malus baccata var. baccata]
MEQLKNHQQQSQPEQSKKPTKSKAPMIKYISSPMMVQARSASEFRAIVQQFTGQNSNTAFDEDCTTTHEQEQARWVTSSKFQASKPGTMIRFSDHPKPAAVLDQMDENNLWEAVVENLSSYQPPCVYV